MIVIGSPSAACMKANPKAFGLTKEKKCVLRRQKIMVLCNKGQKTINSKRGYEKKNLFIESFLVWK